MEEKLEIILIKLNKLQEDVAKLQHAMDSHRTEHSLMAGPGMQNSAPPGFPPSGNTPGGYSPGGIPMGGGVPFGPPGM